MDIFSRYYGAGFFICQKVSNLGTVPPTKKEGNLPLHKVRVFGLRFTYLG